MKETLLSILEDIRPDIDFENEDELVDAGVLESFDIMTIMAEIDSQLGIEIPGKEVSAANFNSLDALLNLLETLK